MSAARLTAEQNDILQEVVNIAMGQAGDSLARILDSYVQLSVPRVRDLDVRQVEGTVREMIGHGEEVSAVRQAFHSQLRGEAIVIFGAEGSGDLAELMGYEDEINAQNHQELLLDVSNLLVGACLNGIAHQLNTELSFSPPSLMAINVPVDTLLQPSQLNWQYALLLEVNFSLEERAFKSHLLILMAEQELASLRQSLDTFLLAI